MTMTGTNFADIERDFIRQKILPDFNWTTFESPSPMNIIAKKLSQCRIALVGTAGAHLPDPPAFDVRSKYGDDSYREIPVQTPAKALSLSHPGYDTRKASEDPNCVFPLDRLRDLASEGVIGELNRRAFSFMGYVPRPQVLMMNRAPEVADKLQEDQVDLVFLVPG